MKILRKFAIGVVLLVLVVSPLSPAFAQKEKAENKPQSAVAAKDKTFATIAESSAEVKKAVKASDLPAAKKMIGKSGAFTGTVVKVYSTKNNSIVILNFAEKYWTALTAPLKPASYKKFPDLKVLEGKKVLISGKFILYDEKVEIELTDPAQVKIVK